MRGEFLRVEVFGFTAFHASSEECGNVGEFSVFCRMRFAEFTRRPRTCRENSAREIRENINHITRLSLALNALIQALENIRLL